MKKGGFSVAINPSTLLSACLTCVVALARITVFIFIAFQVNSIIAEVQK